MAWPQPYCPLANNFLLCQWLSSLQHRLDHWTSNLTWAQLNAISPQICTVVKTQPETWINTSELLMSTVWRYYMEGIALNEQSIVNTDPKQEVILPNRGDWNVLSITHDTTLNEQISRNCSDQGKTLIFSSISKAVYHHSNTHSQKISCHIQVPSNSFKHCNEEILGLGLLNILKIHQDSSSKRMLILLHIVG